MNLNSTFEKLDTAWTLIYSRRTCVKVSEVLCMDCELPDHSNQGKIAYLRMSYIRGLDCCFKASQPTYALTDVSQASKSNDCEESCCRPPIRSKVNGSPC